MKHAFLVLVHSEPEQLLRLVNALVAENHCIYIHVDKKAKSVLESPELSQLSNTPNVKAISLYKVNWGGQNMILATLQLMELALKDSVDWIHIISGQDFPIRTNGQFDSFFEQTKSKAYFSFDPDFKFAMYEEQRMSCYCLNDIIDARNKNLLQEIIIKTSNFLQRELRKYGVHLRKPLGVKVYKGARWFSTHCDVVAYFIDYCKEHPEYVRRFRFTSCCDEIFFHTLLMQSPFCDFLIKDDLRFVKWKDGASSPEWLTDADYEMIVASGDLFCRKVNLQKSSELIEKLSVMQ